MEEFEKWLSECPVPYTDYYLKQYHADWKTIYFLVEDGEHFKVKGTE